MQKIGDGDEILAKLNKDISKETHNEIQKMFSELQNRMKKYQGFKEHFIKYFTISKSLQLMPTKVSQYLQIIGK